MKRNNTNFIKEEKNYVKSYYNYVSGVLRYYGCAELKDSISGPFTFVMRFNI